jgi:GNAT superfamily N-acetyltransferase
MDLEIQLIPAAQLSASQRTAVHRLCSLAFDTDYQPFLDIFWRSPSFHRLELDGHALSSAYVEGVCTHPAHERQGHGTALMQRLAAEIQGYAIGGLATGSFGFYERLGWRRWLGDGFVRHADGALAPCPQDCLMILTTLHTPDVGERGPVAIEWRPAIDVW